MLRPLGPQRLSLTRAPALAETSDDILAETRVLRDPEIPAAGNGHGDTTIVGYLDDNCSYCRTFAPDHVTFVEACGGHGRSGR